MATIDELIEKELIRDRCPSDIKLYSKAFLAPEHYFIPYHKNGRSWHGVVIGPDRFRPDYFFADYGDSFNTWELYMAPKKKVKKWLWATRRSKDHMWCLDYRYTHDVREFGVGVECVKLPWTEMEFDE